MSAIKFFFAGTLPSLGGAVLQGNRTAVPQRLSWGKGSKRHWEGWKGKPAQSAEIFLSHIYAVHRSAPAFVVAESSHCCSEGITDWMTALPERQFGMGNHCWTQKLMQLGILTSITGARLTNENFSRKGGYAGYAIATNAKSHQ
jgi:hypothetical protein